MRGTAPLGLERDLGFAWDMWAWARLQAGTGKSPVFYYLFRLQPPLLAGSVYASLGREPLRRTLVCLRPLGPVALELDRGRSEAG